MPGLSPVAKRTRPAKAPRLPIHRAFKQRGHNRGVRRMHRMFCKLFLSLAAAAGLVAQLAIPAEAAIGFGAFAPAASLAETSPVENVQFVWGGHNYCWYASAWRGPGWYRCGFAWRRGLGWGGGAGWHNWNHRSVHVNRNVHVHRNVHVNRPPVHHRPPTHRPGHNRPGHGHNRPSHGHNRPGHGHNRPPAHRPGGGGHRGGGHRGGGGHRAGGGGHRRSAHPR